MAAPVEAVFDILTKPDPVRGWCGGTGFGDREVGDYETGWTGFLVTIRNQVEGRRA